MAGFGLWRDRPIFVSSTFGDMQAERDWLREHVLPQLEERAKKLFLHIEWIDLRWGVDVAQAGTEEERELQILRLCLAEIDRCRPFLIGLLGDRYGWVPDPARMQAAALAAGYQAEVADRSVTALEIEYGILASSDQVSRSRFWFRSLPYDRMSAQARAAFSDDGNRDRLEALKQRIRKLMPDRVHEYQAGWDEENGRVVGLKEWGSQVLERVWQDIEAEARKHPVRQADTWQEQERLALAQFVEEKCRDFVGREEILGRLRQAALGSESRAGDWCLCVSGGSGQGKSSLFAEVCRRLENENVLLLAHAAGISLNSTQVDSLLRRWIEELATFLGQQDPAEGVTGREELEQLFSRLLHQASGKRRVVCAIDALNQFERTPAARFQTWLPKDWPENACLLAFAIPGDETAALKARQAALIELGPLSQEDIAAIARKAHAHRRQPYRASVMQVLTGRKQADSTPSAGVPLWLDLALGELLALDADDYAAILARPERTHEQRVEAHLVEKAEKVPAEVEDLYGLMLDRLEEHHGKDLARAFASLIALSRTGWRLSDLKGLLPLVTEAGWDELQLAGLRAGFRNQLVQRGTLGQWDFAHVRLRQAVERRNLGNEADRKRLHSRIADFLETLPINDGLRAAELMFHYIGAGDTTRAAKLFGRPLQGADLAGAVQALARHITAGLEQTPNPGLEFTRLMLEEKTLSGEEADWLGNNCMFDLHDSLLSDTRLEHRLELLLLVHSRLDRLARSDPNNAEWQRDLSVSYERLGDIYRAQGDIPKALKAYEQALAIRDRLARSDPGNAQWQRDLSVSHNKLGDIYVAQGAIPKALKAYEQALAIRDRLARSDPNNAEWQRDLSVSYERLGDIYRAQGDVPKALKAYEQALAIADRLARSDPDNALWQRDLSISYNRLGDIYRAQGAIPKALKAYEQALAIADRLARSDPDNAQWQRDLSVSYERLGDIYVAQGDIPKALKAYEQALAIRDRLARSDPNNASWQRDLSVSHNKLGDIYRAQGDIPKALKAYEADLAIADRLARSDPNNASWQRDLSVSFSKLAQVSSKAGDRKKEMDYLRRCRDVLRGMKAKGMHLDPPIAQLLEQLERLPL